MFYGVWLIVLVLFIFICVCNYYFVRYCVVLVCGLLFMVVFGFVLRWCLV